MSRTDKDRPIWVQNAEHGEIDHDHRDGVCIVSDDQRDRWPAWRHHYSRCNKRVRIEFECTKDEPYVTPGYRWRYAWSNRTCWTSVCVCPIPDSWRDEPHGCDHRVRVGCIGHVRTEYHDEIPCSCDDRPPRATCTPAWNVGASYTSGGIPSDFVRAYYHGPERAREREDLGALRREYNAYGDLEDGDFVNRQARNSMRWVYW